jgi:hypothetical protein
MAVFGTGTLAQPPLSHGPMLSTGRRSLLGTLSATGKFANRSRRSVGKSWRSGNVKSATHSNLGGVSRVSSGCRGGELVSRIFLHTPTMLSRQFNQPLSRAHSRIRRTESDHDLADRINAALAEHEVLRNPLRCSFRLLTTTRISRVSQRVFSNYGFQCRNRGRGEAQSLTLFAGNLPPS